MHREGYATTVKEAIEAIQSNHVDRGPLLEMYTLTSDAVQALRHRKKSVINQDAVVPAVDGRIRKLEVAWTLFSRN